MATTTIRERVTHLAGLLARERAAMAEFISELADFDQRRCWERLGYPSLFEFLVRELRVSRGNAFYRVKAVLLIRQYPEVLEALREGKLCITTLPEIARVLTPRTAPRCCPGSSISRGTTRNCSRWSWFRATSCPSARA